MKSIKEETTLAGKIEEITMTELRARPGEVVDSVALGKTFVVTKQSKAVAVISAPPGQNLTTVVESDGKITYSL